MRSISSFIQGKTLAHEIEAAMRFDIRVQRYFQHAKPMVSESAEPDMKLHAPKLNRLYVLQTDVDDYFYLSDNGYVYAFDNRTQEWNHARIYEGRGYGGPVTPENGSPNINKDVMRIALIANGIHPDPHAPKLYELVTDKAQVTRLFGTNIPAALAQQIGQSEQQAAAVG